MVPSPRARALTLPPGREVFRFGRPSCGEHGSTSAGLGCAVTPNLTVLFFSARKRPYSDTRFWTKGKGALYVCMSSVGLKSAGLGRGRNSSKICPRCCPSALLASSPLHPTASCALATGKSTLEMRQDMSLTLVRSNEWGPNINRVACKHRKEKRGPGTTVRETRVFDGGSSPSAVLAGGELTARRRASR